MNDIEFNSKESGVLLRGRFIQATPTEKKSPLVVMLTGDGRKGSKSLSWVNMPPMLRKEGISSFLFDFEGLGYSDGERENLTISVGIDNFRSAWEELLKIDWIDHNNISFFASSFGATVLLLCPEIANQARSIGLKSPAAFLPDAYFKEIGLENYKIWQDKGFLEENGYNYHVFQDSLSYNAYATARQITTPCLITQGDNDEVIPLQHSIYLHDCIQSADKEISVFKGASHGYSEGDSWNIMANMFVSFFSKQSKRALDEAAD